MELAIDAEDYASRVAVLLWPAAQGDSPGGERLLALPSAQRARLLVPTQNRAVAAAAVRRYNVSISLRDRLTTRLVASGLRSGVLQMLSGRRLRLADAQTDGGGISALLRDVVSPRCEVAVYIGIPRRNRKPVLLVFEPDGTLSAVGKLAVSPLASVLVRNEAAALQEVAAAGIPGVIVPTVLFSGQWSGHELLVQSALPEVGRRPKDAERQRDEGAVGISAVGGLRHVRLKVSGVLEQLAARSELLPGGEERSLITRSLAALRDKAGTIEIPVGSWHGDWTPWNQAATKDGLLVWDWERFATGVPAGYDALHCAGQEMAAKHHDPQAALTAVQARLDPLLRPFGVVPIAQPTVFALYLLEILVRYTEDSQVQVAAGRRWVEALTSRLAAVTSDLLDGNIT